MSDRKTVVGDIFSFSGYDAYMITGFEGRERAFVEIQQGCNHRCTYCIVPYARGANRSVPEEKIMAQIALLLQQGDRKDAAARAEKSVEQANQRSVYHQHDFTSQEKKSHPLSV